MKRIIVFILSIMFCSILCSRESCVQEKDQSKCTSHTMEEKFNYFSCFKYENDEKDDVCIPFFTSEKTQQTFQKYMRGYQKEMESGHPYYHVDETLVYYEIDTKNKIIGIKETPFMDSLTDKDKKILYSNNTCLHRSLARFIDSEYYKGVNNLNISDKNLCLNVERYDDLKDILDCGYATIKVKYNNKVYVLNNCFATLDNNVEDTFKQAYKDIYFSSYYETYKQIIPEFMKKVAQNPDKSKRRQLEEEYDFEISVEDRHGNIIHYNKNGEEIDGDEPTKTLNSSRYSFNIKLLLCYILLLY